MQNLLEVARSTESFAFSTRGALKLCRFSSPDLSSLRFFAPPETGCRLLGGGGEGTNDISDYESALFFTLNVIFLRIQVRNSYAYFKMCKQAFMESKGL